MYGPLLTIVAAGTMPLQNCDLALWLRQPGARNRWADVAASAHLHMQRCRNVKDHTTSPVVHNTLRDLLLVGIIAIGIMFLRARDHRAEREDETSSHSPGPPPRGEGAQMGEAPDHHRPMLGRRGRLTGWLIGLAGGTLVTEFNIELGHRGRAVVFVIAAVLALTALLFELDTRARLRRCVWWVLLTSAAIATAVAAFIVGPATGTPAIAALVLMTCAAWLAADPKAAARLMGGAAVIAAGLAVIGAGAAMLAKRDVSASAAVVGAGVAIVGVGAAMLADREVTVDAALVGAGLAVLGVGAAMLAQRDVSAGMALMGVGVTVVGVGAAMLTHREVTVGAASMGAGVAAAGIATAMLTDREVLFGAAAIGGAAALIWAGVAVIGPADVWSALCRLRDWLTKAPPTREGQESST
jgi:hypothetical protein